MVSHEIRICMFYEFKLGSTAAETYRNIIKVWGDNSLCERSVNNWFAKFRSGDFDLENQDRGRPPTLVDNGQLKTLIEEDPTKTVREIAADLQVDAATISSSCSTTKKGRLDGLTWMKHLSIRPNPSST